MNRTSGTGPANRIVIGTLEGVVTLERNNSGSKWSISGRTLQDRHIGSLVYEAGSGKLFAGAHANGGAWVSDDGEDRNWRPINVGLDRLHVYALAARSYGEDVTLFLGTSPAALYRSTDLGENWTELPKIRAVPDIEKWTFPPPPHIPHVKDIAFHPEEPKTVYALVENGAFLKSTDNGDSWAELSGHTDPNELAYRDVHRLLIAQENPDHMFLASGDGLYRTYDGGQSWDRLMKPGDRLGYPDFLFFAPGDEQTVFVAGSRRNPGIWYEEGLADSSVQRSTDGGNTWTELNNGLPSPVIGAFEALSMHSWHGGIMLVLGLATGEIYASEDAGEIWVLIAEDVTPVSRDDHHLPFISDEVRRAAMKSRELA